jgi:pyroglutamyl-peptidase
MKNILITGFIGNNNSSKILLDNLRKNNYANILYLDNDFVISEKQLKNEIKNNEYDIIFSLGQKLKVKSIYIEIVARNESEKLETNYDYIGLKNYMEDYFKIKISENAGKYLCNNIYYKGLKYIYDNKLKTKMVFIHIPYLKNVDIKHFSKIIIKFVENLVVEKNIIIYKKGQIST